MMMHTTQYRLYIPQNHEIPKNLELKKLVQAYLAFDDDVLFARIERDSTWLPCGYT